MNRQRGPGGGGGFQRRGHPNFGNFHRMFEEQMRASGGRGFETFFGGGGPGAPPKTCDR